MIQVGEGDFFYGSLFALCLLVIIVVRRYDVGEGGRIPVIRGGDYCGGGTAAMCRPCVAFLAAFVLMSSITVETPGHGIAFLHQNVESIRT